jgi:hypothetical protein
MAHVGVPLIHRALIVHPSFTGRLSERTTLATTVQQPELCKLDTVSLYLASGQDRWLNARSPPASTERLHQCEVQLAQVHQANVPVPADKPTDKARLTGDVLTIPRPIGRQCL